MTVQGTSGGVMVSKLDSQTYTSEFESHWVPHSFGLVLNRSKDLRKLLKFMTVVEGDQKAPFSIATTLGCRGGRYSFPWIVPLYS